MGEGETGKEGEAQGFPDRGGQQVSISILGPGQLGPAGHLGPGAQLSTFSRRTVGPRMNHIFQDMHIYMCVHAQIGQP